MVKFYENTFSYDYQWPAVTLAYFLRYPNPYSTHVVSTDTLHTRIDPTTGNLHITRLHLKRGKLPASVARFIPKIKESYILEKSIVDTRRQTLSTETRNLDWDGVLSVVENQVYSPAGADRTDVKTVVRFESKLGSARRHAEEGTERRGWLGGWGAGSVQRSIELVGRSRMRDGLNRSREGMKIVLEQLRERGFVGVVKEQRQGGWERWRKVWRGEGKVEEA
ncbi:MSF1-domain-containing protein [Wilcoxina mikolae CBS 423.85]|nr:MSF1-domain-containing protein [Wilcoxina mikolae CBS 423.85]